VNGSVYFDVEKYNNTQDYGILNGRNLDDLLTNTRSLAGRMKNAANLILHYG